MGKRARFLALGGALVLLAGLSLYVFGNRRNGAGYAVTPVDRGEIAEVVGATGVLQAVTTVQVGSQVSGTIQSLYADFNSTVKKGQLLARLDPSLFEARLAQVQANLMSARANVERSKAAMEDARQKYERAKQLSGEQLLAQADLDSAKATYDGAVAEERASQGAVGQAGAAVNQAKVDLDHTVIEAPIDGVVLGRSVDVGQTVAASLQAPTLFIIANDLTQMEVNASIDEADIGRVQPAQPVSFRVDAFPDDSFKGTVKQVRLQPIVNQNVVTYNTIIAVDNPGQRLMPGMTATVSVIVRSKKDVLRVPSAALRFRPEGYEERGGQRAAQRAAGGAATGGRGGASGRPRSSPGGAGSAPSAASDGSPRPGLVFVLGEDGRPQPKRVRLGLSDGQHTEIVEGLAEGDKVITGAGTGTARGPSRPAASPSGNNPFAPQRPQPRTR